MLAKLQQYLGGITDPALRRAIVSPLRHIADRLASQTLTSAGLAIKAGGSAVVKAGSAFHALANGVLVKTAAGDLPALSGTVTNGKFNVFVFYIDAAGNISGALGGEGASLGQVTFPNQPTQLAMIGFVIVNPTGTGNFVGGTTALDDATVVPNAVYVNTLGAVDPTVQLGA